MKKLIFAVIVLSIGYLTMAKAEETKNEAEPSASKEMTQSLMSTRRSTMKLTK